MVSLCNVRDKFALEHGCVSGKLVSEKQIMPLLTDSLPSEKNRVGNGFYLMHFIASTFEGYTSIFLKYKKYRYKKTLDVNVALQASCNTCRNAKK